MQFAIIGSGSWATALAKILTDNGQHINWLVRNQSVADHIRSHHHNPSYLSAATFNSDQLTLFSDIRKAVVASDHIIIAVPSAYLVETLGKLQKTDLVGKKIISAVKGIIPTDNVLLND